MKPVAVHHVSINVDDVLAAVSFYTDVLGLTVRTDRPDFRFGGAWLDAGGQQIHLIEGPVPPNQGQHFALQVEDVVAIVGELRDRGIKVSDPVKVAAGLQSFLNDPAGNSVELQQPNAV